MALRESPALQNFLQQGGSFKEAFNGGVLELWSGAQPATADLAPVGTLLCTYTDASGSHTNEVQALGAFTISGTTGSLDTVKFAIGGGTPFDILGGSVPTTGNVNTMATAVAKALNNSPWNKYVRASSTGSSGVVTLTALPGFGSSINGWVPSATVTSTTSVGTVVNMGASTAGVDAVNGLRFDVATAGVLIKDAAQTWSGVAGNSGTAQSFRLKGAVADAGSVDSSAVFLRLDGNVGTSGANLNLSSTTITASATQTISAATVTEPAA